MTGVSHRQHRRVAIASVVFASFAALAVSGAVAALGTDMDPSEAPDGDGLDIPLSAAFYADTSCLLTIDRRARVGHTLIDATVGDDGSRTLIHCDTEDGQRLSVLARGVTLGRYQRTPLLARASIEDGTKGVIAWLTNAGTSFPDESAPRRYVTQGHVFVTETPQVQASGAAPYVDRRAFARVEGVLETLLTDPEATESDAPEPGAAESGTTEPTAR